MADNNDRVLSALAKMMIQVDQRFDQVTSYVDTRFNDTMTKMDAVYKEVLAMRQEQATHQVQHADIGDRLDAIEAVPVIAHELRAK